MTPLKLQDVLVGKNSDDGGLLGHILRDLRTIDSRQPFNIYDNSPIQRQYGDDKSVYPYCFSTLGDGEDNGETAKQEVVIIVASYSVDEAYSGYRDVMNALERIRQYFMKYPDGNDNIISFPYGSFFEALKPVKWRAPEPSSYAPVFVGGLNISFRLPGISRISPYI